MVQAKALAKPGVSALGAGQAEAQSQRCKLKTSLAGHRGDVTLTENVKTLCRLEEDSKSGNKESRNKTIGSCPQAAGRESAQIQPPTESG